MAEMDPRRLREAIGRARLRLHSAAWRAWLEAEVGVAAAVRAGFYSPGALASFDQCKAAERDRLGIPPGTDIGALDGDGPTDRPG